MIAGQTELGRNLWVLQISDWSLTQKENGEPKEVVYIDGGHHGNEHLGTELAFLTAKHYIDGWTSNDLKCDFQSNNRNPDFGLVEC